MSGGEKMSIKSVDMQVLVQKVGDIARLQQAQHTEANHRQGEFSQLITAQTLANRQTVRDVHDPESKTMQDKEPKKHDQEQGRERRGGEESRPDKDKELFKDYYKGNTIDIKI